MEKPTPIFRFKEDPVHSLILDTLTKKPVNSDYFSLVKRIRIADYTKRPISHGNLDTVAKRTKQYMSEVGFAYGRLIEKNWVPETKEDRLRIHAPGPVLKRPEEEIEEPEIIDNFKSKKLVGFQKAKIQSPEKPATKQTQARVLTTRPTTRISETQRRAREYLVYLNPLSSHEQGFINTQISQKKEELSSKFQKESKKKENNMNERGVFSPDINKDRAGSMVPVKMLGQMKVCIEPMIRKARDEIIKEKSDGEMKECKSESISKHAKKDKFIEMLEGMITKKQIKGRKRESSVAAQKKVKMHWVDRLNNSMFDLINKTKPDEKVSNMLVLL